jgi:hypothetical protein
MVNPNPLQTTGMQAREQLQRLLEVNLHTSHWDVRNAGNPAVNGSPHTATGGKEQSNWFVGFKRDIGER